VQTPIEWPVVVFDVFEIDVVFERQKEDLGSCKFVSNLEIEIEEGKLDIVVVL
jgi:hypothetical protein